MACGNRRIEDIGPHHHSGPAPEGAVIDGAVFIAREPPDVHRFQGPQTFR
jgi:hypothetical protein